jgi:hypothetical protein
MSEDSLEVLIAIVEEALGEWAWVDATFCPIQMQALKKVQAELEELNEGV